MVCTYNGQNVWFVTWAHIKIDDGKGDVNGEKNAKVKHTFQLYREQFKTKIKYKEKHLPENSNWIKGIGFSVCVCVVCWSLDIFFTFAMIIIISNYVNASCEEKHAFLFAAQISMRIIFLFVWY